MASVYRPDLRLGCDTCQLDWFGSVVGGSGGCMYCTVFTQISLTKAAIAKQLNNSRMSVYLSLKG